MQYDFDRVRDRRASDSIKWQKYGEGVLPLWVADMDFVSPAPVVAALHKRVDEGIFGYSRPSPELCRIIQERLQRLYHWEVEVEEIFPLPGLVTGLNLFFHTFTAWGEGVLVQPPIYPHFHKDPICHGRSLADPPLVRRGDTYEIDWDAFDEAIDPLTKVFMLCNPHNPVGRVYTIPELEKMAEVCLRHDLFICSDEIHCDLIYRGYRHTPIASLDAEVAARTVTLMAPSKTFNLPGMGFSFAIIENRQLQERWREASLGLIPHPTIMGHVAALAAYRDGQEWLDQLLIYLEGNRDFLSRSVAAELPGITMARVEGTYLAWLDCRQAGIPGSPFDFFLNEGKVAMNSGVDFGKGGEGYLRLNFACPRSVLAEAVGRISAALKKI